eukprot:TRINITY_DN1167_c4_g1_i1.p1 TRINITY_DN1167_c4_g1~~TRINITY_DN1167_c4_g1_i1.p1  ORF type:complete len:450 (+),score=28.81 TRINITY_DN1167_c4_g1_i1:118-1467(+)
MHLAKAMYFINTVAAIPWGRYKVVYFYRLGLNATQIGFLRGATHTAKLVAWPLWGAICDYIKDIRSALIGSLISATVALELLRWCGAQHEVGFATVLILAILRSSMNAEWPLVDAATIALVQRHEQQHQESGSSSTNSEGYGKQRLWAALAWGVASLYVGVCIDRYGIQTVFLLTYAAVFLEIIIILKWLPSDLCVVSPNPPSTKKESILNWPLAFLLNCLLYSMAYTIPDQIILLHLEASGASRSLQGTAIACSVIFEIPVFYYSDYLTHIFSARLLVFTAQFIFIGRLLLYLAVVDSDMRLVIPIQLLNGFSFGLLWASAVPYIQSNAPAGRETFAQSVLCTVWGTLGPAIGSIMWGYVYDQYGIKAVYHGGIAMVALTMLTLTLPTHWWTDHRREPATEPDTPLSVPTVSWRITSKHTALEHLCTSDEEAYTHERTHHHHHSERSE